jgi:hypothetical protein
MSKKQGRIISKTFLQALSGHLNEFLFESQADRGLHDNNAVSF